ncbi:MAG: hypothetical protein GY841_15800 [FCB group bacterium]|nr:hypothetical protein [FCB group bacterium]
MNCEEQLRLWVSGEPMHNDEGDECTPDLACCRGKKVMAPESERQAFLDAYLAGDRPTCKTLISKFLTAILSVDFPDLDIQVNGFEWGKDADQ